MPAIPTTALATSDHSFESRIVKPKLDDSEIVPTVGDDNKGQRWDFEMRLK